MNVQVLAGPAGRLLRASPALPGAVHDIHPARGHGIIDALTEAGVRCRADKGYQGATDTIRVPYRGRWYKLSRTPGGSQPRSREDQGSRRTGHGHPQDLPTPTQSGVQHHPHHRLAPKPPSPST